MSPTALRELTRSAGAAQALRTVSQEPYYLPLADEVAIFEHAHARKLAVMLKGPTGCGKTRFVEHMAWRLQRPLVTVACHDDLTASDLVGRFLVRDDSTVWHDGPLTRAVRDGAICYLDELVEARQDTTVVIHPLADHRRLLPVDKTGELIEAADGFQLVISYNPSYQHALKDLKPSTRQRFVSLEFTFPPREQEVRIVEHESGVGSPDALALVALAERLRALQDRGLTEVPSTRLLVAAGQLIARGVEPRRACDVAIVTPLSDEPTLLAAMRDIVEATFA
jgi:nitric oxide reductase NorQ protein